MTTATTPGECSPEEAAVRLGVSVWTAHRYIRAGRLRARRDFRGRVRVDAASVSELLALTPPPPPERRP